MTSKRPAKRQKAAQPACEAPPELTEERVLEALDARADYILQHEATVTPKTLLNWLQQDLGLPDQAALRPHRHAVKDRALELLAEQGQLPSNSLPASASDLPAEILAAVLQRLDHDSLFCALAVCKAWRAAGADGAGALWEQQFAARGWGLPQPATAAAGPAMAAAQRSQQQSPQQLPSRHQHAAEQHQKQQPQAEPNEQQHVDWKERYQQQYRRCCYDCFRSTERHTLAAGSLRILLCRDCWASYISPRPQHRLVSSSHAKRQYCLKETELDPLLRCVDSNPVEPAFNPMHLYRKLDVRRLAVARWGSWEAVQAEHRKRITRS